MNKATELIENEIISEPEIINLISSTYKLVKNGIFKQKKLDSICDELGVKQIDDNVFELNEYSTYTLK
jgi:hypothetical protein